MSLNTYPVAQFYIRKTWSVLGVCDDVAYIEAIDFNRDKQVVHSCVDSIRCEYFVSTSEGAFQIHCAFICIDFIRIFGTTNLVSFKCIIGILWR